MIKKDSLLLVTVQVLFISLLLIILPFIRLDSVPNALVISKAYFLSIVLQLMGVITCFYLLWRIFTNDIKLRVSVLDVLLIVYLGFISLNRYFIQDDFVHSIRYFELLLLGVLYFILRFYNFNKTFSVIIFLMPIVGLIQSIYGVFQILGVFPSMNLNYKLTGSFFNPGPYAGYLSILFPFVLGLYLFKDLLTQNSVIKIQRDTLLYKIIDTINFLAIITMSIAILLANSRAAFLGMVFSSSLLLVSKYRLLFHFRSLSKKKKSLISFAFLTTFLFGGIALYVFKKDSANGRVLIWKSMLERIKNNPLYGVGYDRFKVFYMQDQANYFHQSHSLKEELLASNSMFSFNEFLSVFYENGFVGFIVFCCVLFILFKFLVKINKLNIVFLGAAISGFLFSLFSYPSQILEIKIIFTFLLVYVSIQLSPFLVVNNLKKNHYTFSGLSKVGFVVGICILSFSSYKSYMLTQHYKEKYAKWGLANTMDHLRQNKPSVDSYELAKDAFMKNGDFLLAYGKAVAKSTRKDNDGLQILLEARKYMKSPGLETSIADLYKEKSLYSKAEYYYKNALSMIPSRFYPHYLLTKCYVESGNIAEARKEAKKIMNKPVKVSSKAVNKMKEEIKLILKKTSGVY